MIITNEQAAERIKRDACWMCGGELGDKPQRMDGDLACLKCALAEDSALESDKAVDECDWMDEHAAIT